MSKSDSCLNLTSTGGHQYIKREPIDETVELTLIPEVVQTPKEVSPPPPAATPTGHSTKIILETVEPIQFQYNQSPQPSTNQTTNINNQPIKKEAVQVPNEKKKRSKPTKASTSATSGEKKESKPKKHACTLCPKKFTRPAELQRHIRVHTGEKPFKCELCHQGFRRKDHLTSERIYTFLYYLCCITYKLWQHYPQPPLWLHNFWRKKVNPLLAQKDPPTMSHL